MQKQSTGIAAILAYTGASYRMLDYWTRTGVLQLDAPTPGSGTARRWTADELKVARRIVMLTRAGLTLEAAHKAARNWGVIARGVWVSYPPVPEPPEGVIVPDVAPSGEVAA